MKRLLPFPFLAIALFAMWLLLTQSFSPGQIVLGLAVALLATQAVAALKPDLQRIRSLRAALRLSGIVIVDIIRSNLAVAGLILFPRQRISNFVRFPLELRNRHGLALLALIITATPGTIWVEFDRARGILLVHILDLVDEEEWIRLIKQRYESLLLEMFEA